MSFSHLVLAPRRVRAWRPVGNGVVAAIAVRAAPETASYLVRVSAR
jgi:hypothetical protein